MNKKEQYLYFCDFEVCIFKKRLYISVKGKNNNACQKQLICHTDGEPPES